MWVGVIVWFSANNQTSIEYQVSTFCSVSIMMNGYKKSLEWY